MTKQEQELIILGHIIIKHYYSFKIFSCFWLVKTTCIHVIYHNQLLLTKFGKNLVILNQWCQKCSPLQFIEPMKSKWIMYLMGGRNRCIGRYISRYIGRYLMEYRSILDRIYRYIGRVSVDIYLVAHRDFTDTWPILHRYCTNASPTLYLHRMYWLISIDISVDTLVDTRPVDKCSSIGRCICRYIGLYIGRYIGR